MDFQKERLAKLKEWMVEREAIRQRREAGKPKPWTQNFVLQGTRFCNVRRMDDKVSQWLLKEWYGTMVTNRSAPGQMLCAVGLGRLLNWPESLTQVLIALTGEQTKAPYQWVWDQSTVINTLRAYRNDGNKVFTGAYIINAAGSNGRDKIEVICRQANTLWMHGELLDTRSMEATHTNLMRVPGIGSFMAGQMVADLRHICPGGWSDAMTWAPLGPGSHRGVNWLLGWDGESKLPRMPQSKFIEHLREVIKWGEKNVKAIAQDRKLEAHDWQNCLCEYDKYMRLLTNTGRAKNHYAGV